MSISAPDILGEILRVARGNGLDQAGLARAAGVAPETISRAKKRGNIELRTLTALAAAATVELRVEPVAVQPSPNGDGKRRSSLADPRWGIAWSNQNMDAPALITNALLKGSYGTILEAAVQYGIDLVRRQWDEVKDARSARESKHARTSVDRILNNIEKGFARAET
jgi:transcriptional regulator with XRE-family HTH domain